MNPQKKPQLFNTKFILFFTLLVSVLAWATYGTVEGIFGMLSYVLVGLLGLLLWVIPPFIGMIFGVLDTFNIAGPGMYGSTLAIARLDPSWMTAVWFTFVSVVGIGINLDLSFQIYFKLKKKLQKKKRIDTNLALINCNIIDGDQNSPIINNGVILIKNVVERGETSGLITQVGKAAEIEIPSDYRKVDLEGNYVLPGLINAHCHMIGNGKPTTMVNVSDDIMERVAGFIKLGFVKRVLKQRMITNIRTALKSGVTTMRTLGDPSYLDVKIRDEIKRGKLIGPRIICSGNGVCPTGGHGGPMGFTADDVGEVRKRVRENLRKDIDVLKISSTGGVLDSKIIGEAGRPQMTVEEIDAFCTEAHRGGIMVATHCQSAKGIKEALLGGVDTIEHGSHFPDELIDLFKNNPKSMRGYTCLVPTLAAGMGMATLPRKDSKISYVISENAKMIEKGMIQGLQKAYKNGIKIGMGTDSSAPFATHYDVWKELKYYLKYTDMKPQQAIYYGTKGTAKVLGIDDITGSISVGKSADLQIVEGNPIEDINHLGKVKKVVIFGRLISNTKVKKIKNEKEVIPLEL